MVWIIKINKIIFEIIENMKKTILLLSFVGINNLQGSQENSHQISSNSVNQNNFSVQRTARSAEAAAQLPDFDLLPPVAVHNNDQIRLARAYIAASQIGQRYQIVSNRVTRIVDQDPLSDQLNRMDIDEN